MMGALAVFEEIPVAVIRVLNRTRSVSADAVAVLRQSYQDHGGFTTPIHVRKAKSGYELIDGAHRLTLAQELGLETILARVWQCTQAEARFFEVDANLALSHLTPVALARSLAVRHEAYLKLHPGTAAGVAGGKARQGQQTTDLSFAEFLGAVIGVSPRQVQRITRAGKALSPDEAVVLEVAPKRVAMEDLYEIAKISAPEEHEFVISALAHGTANKASAARKLWKAEHGQGPAPILSNTDKTHVRLEDAWKRAPKEARRRFLEAHGVEVQALLDEMRDE